MISGAEIMVNCLKKEGVRVLFGYPGAAICPFYDKLSGIRHILVRQEQNAGHAASGYARISGKAGVCVATSGPGATNLITAIATAYQDSIPVVAITGQVSTRVLGRDVFQEADITGACEPFTKHSYLVKNTAELAETFREAFHIAATGRPGPVLIDVPFDIQTNEIDSFEYPERVDIQGYKPSAAGHIMQVKRACEAIKTAKKPVICAGGGIFSAGALSEFRKFTDKMGIPVAHTMMGKGAVPGAHPLSLGMLGTHGVYAANSAILGADLVLIFGARVGDRALAAPEQVAKRAKIIHIDIDPAEIGKNMPAHIPIVGDLRLILRQLNDAAEPGEYTEWRESCTAAKLRKSKVNEISGYVEPNGFIKALSDLAAEDAILVADVGQNQIWSANCFEVKSGRFLTSGGLGTMGYSVPAAVGASLAAPDKQVIAVCGDGSFQMQMMELGTICQHDIPVKLVIMNNGKLGMVRELQEMKYNCNEVQVDLSGSPDFIKIAAAYGIPAREISSNDEAEGAVKEMLASGTAYLLVCNVAPQAPSR